MNCWNCKQDLNPEFDFGRQDMCSKCHSSTRSCKNCIHFDTSRYNECEEPVADRVVDKEKSTFCDYFKAGANKLSGRTSQTAKSAAMLAAEALFKKK